MARIVHFFVVLALLQFAAAFNGTEGETGSEASGVQLVEGEPEVRIAQGTLRGSVFTSDQGKKIYAFRGVPYAEPPVGDLRFKRPQPHRGWNGTRQVTDSSALCLQYDYLVKTVNGEEDCLYLNVYTTILKNENATSETALLPVMVWIHGGFYLMGSGDYFMAGPEKLADYDVLLVTINYRLAVLGFLSTGDDAAPGNYGALDVLQALKWVQQNIAAFGGDPNRVTAFGNGAGAALATILAVSPLSRGLVHRVIAQSGSPFCDWAVEHEPLIWTNQLAESVGCTSDKNQQLIECLRSKSGTDLIEAESKLHTVSWFPIIFGPVVDPTGAGLLPRSPKDLIAAANATIPFIVGVNQYDGSFHHFVIKNKYMQEGHEFIELELPKIIKAVTALRRRTDAAVPLIREEYFKDIDPENSKQLTEAIIEMLSDSVTRDCADSTIRELSSRGFPTYGYMITHVAEFSLLNYIAEESKYGVTQADEIQYLMSSPILSPPTQNEDDIKVGRLIRILWTNFAKSGNPSPNGEPTPWEPFTNNQTQYLDIKVAPIMVNESWTDHSGFWTDLLTQL